MPLVAFRICREEGQSPLQSVHCDAYPRVKKGIENTLVLVIGAS